MKPLFSVRPATGICCLLALLSGCASQPEPAPVIPQAVIVQEPSPEELLQERLKEALAILQDNRLADAQTAYNHALEQAIPGTRSYHEACAGLIVTLSKGGDNPVRDLNRALEVLDTLNASMARTSRTLDSYEQVIFVALRQLLEGEIQDEKLQKQLSEETRKQQQLVRENQQLQEALFKLRRLSLE